MESEHYARSGGPRNAVECSQLTLQAGAAGKQQLRVGSYVPGSARMKGAKQRERSSGEKAWRLGCKRDPEEVGVPPRRAWRGQTLRKLPGYGGHAVAHRDTRKSSCTHTSAYGNTLYHWVHTRRPLTRRSREGITGRSCRPAHPHPHPHPPQSFPTRPSKGLRNRRRLQPAPPSPGRVKREAGGGKGCVPVPCCAESRGSGRGEALGGGAPAPIKSPYARTDINKPYQATLSRQQADCSPIFVSLFTSRGALHLQPCGWFLSVLACSLGKPSELLLPPGQNKDPQESLSSGATGHPARLLWPLRRSPVAPAPEGSLASLERVSITIRQGEKKRHAGSRFLSNWGSGIKGLKLGRRT